MGGGNVLGPLGCSFPEKVNRVHTFQPFLHFLGVIALDECIHGVAIDCGATIIAHDTFLDQLVGLILEFLSLFRIDEHVPGFQIKSCYAGSSGRELALERAIFWIALYIFYFVVA